MTACPIRAGPSMYEMEGPARLAALVSRLLGDRWLPGTAGVRIPPSRPVARPFQRSPGCPGGGSRLQR